LSSILPLLVPTVLSAIAVFVLSSILHMLVPAWHRSDYPKLPNEDAVLDALRPLAIPPGEYMAPRPADSRDMKSPEFLEKMNRGPVLILNVHQPGVPSMGRPLALWFVYLLVVAWASGHVAWGALRDHNDPVDIFHTVGLTAFMGYAFALWQGTIWYRRPWLTTLKSTIDGLLYAIVTGLLFVYCWPS
jgi:hypothetical protein